MVYISDFSLSSEMQEEEILNFDNRTYLVGGYPFHMFSNKELKNISFDNITIFYGDNGSGKSTLPNIIAEVIGAKRRVNQSLGDRFFLYTELCHYKETCEIPEEVKMISSDDVFGYMFNVRRINNHEHNDRQRLIREYVKIKDEKIHDFNDFQKMFDYTDSKLKSMNECVQNENLYKDIQEQSNGESALMYFLY